MCKVIFGLTMQHASGQPRALGGLVAVSGQGLGPETCLMSDMAKAMSGGM